MLDQLPSLLLTVINLDLGWVVLVLVAGLVISLRVRKAYPFLVALGLSFLLLLLLPAIPAILHSRSPRMDCSNHLKTIALALHDYHAEWNSLPPPVTYGEDGHAMHSWRALILPYLEEEGKVLGYRLDEPWNGPHNSQLIAAMPRVFQCNLAGSAASRTNYLAVVSSRDSYEAGQTTTAWADGQALAFRDLLDGTSNIILLVESSTDSVIWTEPRDLRYETLPLTINHEIGVGISSNHPGGCQCAFADGSIHIADNPRGNAARTSAS